MDKKNTLLGILCLVAAFAMIPLMNKERRDAAEAAAEEQAANPPAEVTESVDEPEASSPEEAVEQITAATEEVITAVEETVSVPEELSYLKNDFIEVIFTNQGGGIKKVSLLEYEQEKDSGNPYLFNHYGYAPMLGISINDGAYDESYTKSFQSDTEIHFERQRSDGLLVRKKFSINPTGSGKEEYSIHHSIEFFNTGSNSLLINDYQLHLGTMEPALLGGGAFMGDYLNVGYIENGDKEFIGSRKFIRSNGFLGIGSNKNPPPFIRESAEYEWVSLKNQFFVSILTPEAPGSGVVVTPRPLDKVNDKGEQVIAISGDAEFQLTGLQANEKIISDMEFYVGPKEIFRLQNMEQEQEAVMQFGWFGSVSKILLLGMKQIHAFIPNWGVAIIIITIVLKLLFWPLTQISARSAKKMQKIQGPMKELTEKYKDDPQRKNQEMMKLYRTHKVNPLGGCLPMLVQIPIFIGFFYMLRSSSELRFAEFLWISDLSQAEKIFSWGFSIPFIGEYFNLLPILMATTMYFQMKMTPTAGSPEQQAIFKFMPVMMLVMLYNFGSGLCLYWTVQNLMTILQQTITNKRKDKEEIAEELKANDPNKPVDNPLIRKKPKRKNKKQQ